MLRSLLLALLPALPTRPAQESLARGLEAEVVRVVDGDTLDVRLEGRVESLRLLFVDTEEKISARASRSPTKPETVFGQETTLWAQALFASFGAPVRVGLAFPEGRRRDAFGRLLCEVFLPDGRDYNLLLVAEGRSPYFNKYGNSRGAHRALLEAQAAAQAGRLGIWNPATNRARTPGVPSAVRPYAELLPWWNARAAAIDGFREDSAAAPDQLLSHEDAQGLQLAFERCQADPARRVTVFAAIERFFEEQDGALTALLASGDGRESLRARIPAENRATLEPRLRLSTHEFRQNFLLVTGRLERNRRGLVLTGAEPADWVTADPPYPPAPEADRR